MIPETSECVKISMVQRQAHFSPTENQEVRVTLSAQRRFLHALSADGRGGESLEGAAGAGCGASVGALHLGPHRRAGQERELFAQARGEGEARARAVLPGGFRALLGRMR